MKTLVWQICVSGMTLIALGASAAEGVLGANQRISSTHLGYDLQYRVYKPANIASDQKLPSLYVTDGQRYLAGGNFRSVLDRAISSGAIEPVLVVFLDSRNPDNLQEDRRNAQFMCNKNFASFFATELVPLISEQQPVARSRDHRVILGVSFGGLNSACFGLMLPELFYGIAMQSPASTQHLAVISDQYQIRETVPIKMFLSVGSRNDNTAAIKRFKRTLESKGYDLNFIRVRGQHNWKNWGPLLDDVLLTYFASPETS